MSGNSRPVIIFLEGGLEFLLKYVVRDLPYELFDPKKELCRISLFHIPSYIKFFFYDVFQLKHFSLKPSGLKFLYKHLRARILLDVIDKRNPSCLLTFVDNNDLFHAISRLRPNWPTIAIQNGGRHSWCATDALASPMEKYHINEYYCFGEQVQSLFQKHKHEILSYKNHGSLLGGVFFSQLRDREKIFDICLISQWSINVRNKEKLPLQWKNLELSIEKLVAQLAEYKKNRSIKICIALRSVKGNDTDERNFYQQYFGDDVVLLENNREEFASYHALSKSHLVLALNSTLASEAFGAQYKVLFVNPLGEDWLKPVEIVGDWYLDSPTQAVFSNRIDSLLNMDTEQYTHRAAISANYSMSYDFSLPLHDVLYRRLKNISVGG